MIVKAELKKGIGKDSGKPYIGLFLEFPNGFKKVYFPKTDEERFLWNSILENE